MPELMLLIIHLESWVQCTMVLSPWTVSKERQLRFLAWETRSWS